MDVTMSKNFFLAGEMAYIAINIDNTACTDACNLIVSHKSQIVL